MSSERICEWCDGPIRTTARRDAKFCGKPCRQASHRFTSRAGSARRVEPARALRLAYADPPYPGMSARYYRDHPDYAGEVDHEALIDQLVEEFPDGWALSTSAASLPAVLALCAASDRPAHIGRWRRGSR